jgi:hypothetical protein
MTTSNEKALQQVENQIHSAPAELRWLFVAKLGLADMLAAAEAAALAHILWQAQNAQVFGRDCAERLESLWHRGGGGEVQTLAKIHAGQAAIERHASHAEAARVFEPLFSERARLLAAIAAETAAHSAAVAAAEESHRQALARAAAAAASDPQVLKAAADLARLTTEPAPPAPAFRGRVKIVAEPEVLDYVLSELAASDDDGPEDPLELLGGN